MKPPKRSRRRADLARMKARALSVYPHDPKAKLANHLKCCSCWMCGNRRKYDGPKRSETKFDVSFDQETSA